MNLTKTAIDRFLLIEEIQNTVIEPENGAEEEGLVEWWRRLKGPGGLL